MIRSRAVVMAIALTTAFTVATGTGQAASGTIRSLIPWDEQTVFALAPDRSYVAEWNGPGAGWTVIGGPASAVYAGSAGVFATDPSNSAIWMYNGTPNSWTKIGGPGYLFAEGGGHLYGIGPDLSYVAEWNGTATGGWTIIGGQAALIAAGPAGMVRQTTDNGGEALLYNGTPGSWTKIGGDSDNVLVGNAIYRTDLNDEDVEQWTGGTNWETIYAGGAGAGVSLDVAGPAGLFLMSHLTFDLEYNGTPFSWTPISDNNQYVAAVSRTMVYGLTRGSSGDVTNVDLYSPSSNTWTTIGGPAYMVLGAGD